VPSRGFRESSPLIETPVGCTLLRWTNAISTHPQAPMLLPRDQFEREQPRAPARQTDATGWRITSLTCTKQGPTDRPVRYAQATPLIATTSPRHHGEARPSNSRWSDSWLCQRDQVAGSYEKGRKPAGRQQKPVSRHARPIVEPERWSPARTSACCLVAETQRRQAIRINTVGNTAAAETGRQGPWRWDSATASPAPRRSDPGSGAAQCSWARGNPTWASMQRVNGSSRMCTEAGSRMIAPRGTRGGDRRLRRPTAGWNFGAADADRPQQHGGLGTRTRRQKAGWPKTRIGRRRR